MFRVRISTEAQAAIAAEGAREGFAKTGLMVHRQGPRGDLKRTATGQAEWSIERPYPWRAQVGDFTTFGENPTDVQVFDGILVWLAVIPREGECGVQVSLRNGALFVEALDA